MSSLANRAFVKMNGLGNEIVVIDMRDDPAPISAEEARAVARPEGAPFDQLMVLYPPHTPGTDAFVRIYNTDGSESGACGNGMRCVASRVALATGQEDMTFETAAGLLDAWRDPQSGQFTVDMGPPRFAWNEIPLARRFDDTRAIALKVGPADRPVLHSPSAVSMGNPHAIFWVRNVDDYDLAALGPVLEYDPLFPERANITLADVISPNHIKVRTWERGAGLTRACGSAACATAVAAARLGKTGRKVIIMPPGGGELVIEWREPDDHVLMTGPVAFEYEGRFDPALFAAGEPSPAGGAA